MDPLDLFVFVGAIVGIVYGLLNIFAKDLIWKWTDWKNKAAGKTSQRTPQWETMTTISGVLLIFAGITLLVSRFII